MILEKNLLQKINGVWSAAPTPFNERMEIDTESVQKMVEHHLKIGISGLFILGTNGEGPCLNEKQKIKLVKSAVKYNKNRMIICAQITDNSSQLMIENAKNMADAGVDILVISAPYFFPRPDEKRLLSLFEEVLDRIDMPFGIYDRGKFSSVIIPVSVLKKLCKNKKTILIKDSSSDEERMKIFLNAKKKDKNLRIFNGNEFDCVKYITAGYDGLLLGGGVFNGYIAGKIIDAVKNGNIDEAEKLQELMNKIMFAVYGGKSVKCWLAGEKYLLVKMGIFNTWKNLYQYILSKSNRKAIDSAFKKYQNLLLPYED
ncbi:MAG: dihydrodipicolinate synthase family protein [Candidatus Omnitrophica bacterium]|nr:dihydrodipicolinate synthase family protein [Candidatus Omnitrophota bacterium]MCM8828916.1 dihydrodipicolinate synthase family protein [Candidatus Omnitrophota bacterium]